MTEANRKQFYKYLKKETIEEVCERFDVDEYPLIEETFYTNPNTGKQKHRE